jgi:hypothetical protein
MYCKLKIGAIDFDAELQLLKLHKRLFSPEQIETGLMQWCTVENASLDKLLQLHEFKIHSEQPIQKKIKLKRWQSCGENPFPIAR